MVYGAIDEKGGKSYTHLSAVFRAIENRQVEYNWLITNCECCPADQETDHMLNRKYSWLTGRELTAIVEAEDFLWIWAVLSGFEKRYSLTDVLEYPLPYADGYKGFWQTPLSIQHPLAAIEIVPWDSSLTLFFSRQRELTNCFISAFPNSKDLLRHHTMHQKP